MSGPPCARRRSKPGRCAARRRLRKGAFLATSLCRSAICLRSSSTKSRIAGQKNKTPDRRGKGGYRRTQQPGRPDRRRPVPGRQEGHSEEGPRRGHQEARPPPGGLRKARLKAMAPSRVNIRFQGGAFLPPAGGVPGAEFWILPGGPFPTPGGIPGGGETSPEPFPMPGGVPGGGGDFFETPY